MSVGDQRPYSRARLRNLAIDQCLMSAAGIVLLILKVPLGSFYVTVLFGFSLGIAIGLLMLGLLWLVYHEPPIFRGQQNSVGALGLFVLVGFLITLVVDAAISYPPGGTTVELILVIALALVALFAIAWTVAMLAKSIAEHA